MCVYVCVRACVCVCVCACVCVRACVPVVWHIAAPDYSNGRATTARQVLTTLDNLQRLTL